MICLLKDRKGERIREMRLWPFTQKLTRVRKSMLKGGMGEKFFFFLVTVFLML